MLMEQSVESGGVEKEETGTSADSLRSGFEIFRIGFMPVGDVERNAGAFEHVAEVFERSHAVFDEEIFLLSVIHHAEFVNGHAV